MACKKRKTGVGGRFCTKVVKGSERVRKGKHTTQEKNLITQRTQGTQIGSINGRLWDDLTAFEAEKRNVKK